MGKRDIEGSDRSLPGPVLVNSEVTFEQLSTMSTWISDDFRNCNSTGAGFEMYRLLDIAVKTVKSATVSFADFFTWSQRGSEGRIDHLRAMWNKAAILHLRFPLKGTDKFLFPVCRTGARPDLEGNHIWFEWQNGQKTRSPKRRSSGDSKVAREVAAIKEPSNPIPAATPPSRELHNLAAENTKFVGREAELAAIKSLLLDERHVTLTGVGGAGKTRLANQVGLEILDRYPDGVRFVELASVSDPRLVARTVADSLDIVGDTPPEKVLDAVTNRLRPLSTFLIVNNCDHLIESSARAVQTLLHGCPRLRVLTTSRAVLGIYGEYVFPVPPMAVPGTDESPAVGDLLSYGAIALFESRARGGRKPFQLNDQNASAVVEICRRLDGIPMFIVLAASRVKEGESPKVVAESLRDVFQALRRGSVTALTKDQTARALIDWSYDPLAENEKRLFRRLSVFRGGWTLESATAICAGDGLREDEVADLHARLVGLSLVEEIAGDEEPLRFKLLEPLREYGHDKLLGSGELRETRRRHLQWLTSFARQGQRYAFGTSHAMWMKRVEHEVDNVRAALDWGPQADEAGNCLTLAAALKWFWIASSRAGEAEKRLRRLLDDSSVSGRTLERARGLAALSALRPFAEQLGGSLQTTNRAAAVESLSIAEEWGDPICQAEAVESLAGMAQSEFDWAEASRLYERSLGLWKSVTSVRGMCSAMLGIARSLSATGAHEKMRAVSKDCLELARRAGDCGILAATLTQLARDAGDSGRYSEARDRWKECLDAYAQLGAEEAYFHALTELTRQYIDDEAGCERETILKLYLPQARQFFEQHLVHARRSRDAARVVKSLTYLGHCSRLAGDVEGAIRRFEQAVGVWRRSRGGSVGLAIVLQSAYEYLRVNDLTNATRLIDECLALACPISDKDTVRWATTMMGVIGSRRGQHAAAVKCFNDALKLARELGHVGTIVFSLYLLANELLRSKRIEDADLAARESMALNAMHDDGGWAGLCHLQLGNVAIARGETEIARSRFEQALEVFVKFGRGPEARIAVQALGMWAALKADFAIAAKCFGIAEPAASDFVWASNPEYERLWATTSTVLGPVEHRKSVAEGADMPLGAAIRWARGLR